MKLNKSNLVRFAAVSAFAILFANPAFALDLAIYHHPAPVLDNTPEKATMDQIWMDYEKALDSLHVQEVQVQARMKALNRERQAVSVRYDIEKDPYMAADETEIARVHVDSQRIEMRKALYRLQATEKSLSSQVSILRQVYQQGFNADGSVTRQKLLDRQVAIATEMKALQKERDATQAKLDDPAVVAWEVNGDKAHIADVDARLSSLVAEDHVISFIFDRDKNPQSMVPEIEMVNRWNQAGVPLNTKGAYRAPAISLSDSNAAIKIESRVEAGYGANHAFAQAVLTDPPAAPPTTSLTVEGAN